MSDFRYYQLLQTVFAKLGLSSDQLITHSLTSTTLQEQVLELTKAMATPEQARDSFQTWAKQTLQDGLLSQDLQVVILGGEVDEKNKTIKVYRLLVVTTEQAVGTFLLAKDGQSAMIDRWYGQVKKSQLENEYTFTIISFVITSDEVVKVMMEDKKYLRAFYKFSKKTITDTSVSYVPTYAIVLTKGASQTEATSLLIDYYNKMSKSDVVLLQEKEFIEELVKTVT